MKSQKAAVLGAGSWGTALAITLRNNGHDVKLWTRESEVAEKINSEKENTRFLKGCPIPEGVEAVIYPEEALFDASIVIITVPSHAVREVVSECSPYINKDAFVVNAAKGFELESLKRISQVIEEELPFTKDRVVVLSGPSHAEEVGVGMPTTVVSASKSRFAAEYIQSVFTSNKFRVYTNPDIVGVELGGALKNVIALATGISDGYGLGDNTKAALMTRGIAEISRLGVSMGASSMTFAGLAGIGDLIVTCTSMHSRNRRAGMQLGEGKKLESILEEMGMVVEGVKTTQAAYNLAREMGVEMPITEQVYRVLFEGQDPAEGVDNLMGRVRTKETEEVVLHNEDW